MKIAAGVVGGICVLFSIINQLNEDYDRATYFLVLALWNFTMATRP